jgi:protein ImuB
MLVDRLLARRERRGRTLRAVAISARLVEGGTWRERVVFREALADPARMRLALGGRLPRLPAPAETLRLSVERFGPPHPAGRSSSPSIRRSPSATWW